MYFNAENPVNLLTSLCQSLSPSLSFLSFAKKLILNSDSKEKKKWYRIICICKHSRYYLFYSLLFSMHFSPHFFNCNTLQYDATQWQGTTHTQSHLITSRRRQRCQSVKWDLKNGLWIHQRKQWKRNKK